MYVLSGVPAVGGVLADTGIYAASEILRGREEVLRHKPQVSVDRLKPNLGGPMVPPSTPPTRGHPPHGEVTRSGH
jgi:hypothetical protein